MTEIWLVRHGETSWNVERRIQGWEDIPLNITGEQQAAALGNYLAKIQSQSKTIHAVYASDLQRAQHTAHIAALPLGLSPILHQPLRERHFGVLQNLLYDEMDQYQPVAAKAWRSRESHANLEGGETLQAFHHRVINTLEEIAAKHPEQVVLVVSHGGALDIAWRQANQVSLSEPRQASLLNASINRIQVSPEGWSMLEWGRVTHLNTATGDEIGV